MASIVAIGSGISGIISSGDGCGFFPHPIKINDDNIEAQGMAAYSPEFMYATETENKADMATTSGLNFNTPDW